VHFKLLWLVIVKDNYTRRFYVIKSPFFKRYESLNEIFIKALNDFVLITYISEHYKEHQTFAMVMWDVSPYTM